MSYVSSLSSDVSSYTPVTTSGEVSFSGLGNGTDFSEIIDATIDAESFQLEAYEEQKEETEYIIDLLEALDDEIEDLNDVLDEMDEPDEFFEMEGSSSGDEVEVELTGEADAGVHTLIVNQLAQKDVWVTDSGFSSEEDTVTTTATTLELTMDGETFSVEISAGTTLEGLVSAVNNDVDSRDKVEAELIYDGEEYYFKLSSADAGADSAITIASNASLTGVSGFDHTQTAQNSQIKVDGFPTGDDEWIERDSNSINDVVEGITFDLKETTDEDGVRISVEYDTDAMIEKVEEFVESVNQIILDIQTLTGRVDDDDDDDDDDTYTIDNYAMDIIYNNIKTCLSSGALGFAAYDEEDGGDYFNALSQIGLSTDSDEGSDTFGQILIDDDELEEAVETDPEAFGNLFSQRAVGESDTEDLQVVSVIDTVTEAGTYDVQYTVQGGVLTSATINGEEAEVDAANWTILGTSDSVSGLYMNVTNQTDGTHGGDVRVKQGIVGSLSDILDDITDEETGTLPILIENYESSVTALDNNIYNEEARLDALENSLTTKYAALDALLSTYSNQADLVDSLMSDL